jgi:hypothetical protein
MVNGRFSGSRGLIVSTPDQTKMVLPLFIPSLVYYEPHSHDLVVANAQGFKLP